MMMIGFQVCFLKKKITLIHEREATEKNNCITP